MKFSGILCHILPLFWLIKVTEKLFGNEILISDCPYVNIAPLRPCANFVKIGDTNFVATNVKKYKTKMKNIYLEYFVMA